MFIKDMELINAAKLVEKKIKSIDPDLLNLSTLGKHQLKALVNSVDDDLYNYQIILSRVREISKLDWDEMALIDYGGGPGIMSILARQLGVGTVIYNDIYSASCNDARIIALEVGLPSHYYVCGDIDSVVGFSKNSNIDCNVIVSYDVLEHIYELEQFFPKISNITKSGLTFVMGTGANTHNRKIRKLEIAKHIKTENEDIVKKWGEGLCDTKHSYMRVRADIIRAFRPELKNDEVEYLAKATRGLIRLKIEQCVTEYQNMGKISYKPKHPTNTCCPHTGYWCERLLDAEVYESLLKKYAKDVNYRGGFYKGRSMLKLIVNYIIYILGKRSLFIAPYILFEARFYPIALIEK